MDGMEVEFCGGFNVCVWLSSCPPVLRFIASATTTAGQTFKLYLIQNKMNSNETIKIPILANYPLKDEKDFVKLCRRAVKDLNVCQFDDMIS